MTIGGFSDISFLYRPYDAYRIPTADTQKSETLGQNITSKQQAVVPEAPVAKAEEATVPVERKNTALEDVSLTFLKDDTYDMIGSESDLNKLDMQKAISDMQKDKILQDYNYFVGSSVMQQRNISEDGVVVAK
ncbi:MAG: hypothetical protein SOW50_09310 [Lachnospiraceae bacterium]|nr:hypothetical protein [Lachnospiraceae bacterium]